MICKHCLMSIERVPAVIGGGEWRATEGVGEHLSRCRANDGGPLDQFHEPEDSLATPVAGPPTTSVVAAIQGLTDRALVDMRRQFAQEISASLYGQVLCAHCGVSIRPSVNANTNTWYATTSQPGTGLSTDAHCLGTDRKHEPAHSHTIPTQED